MNNKTTFIFGFIILVLGTIFWVFVFTENSRTSVELAWKLQELGDYDESIRIFQEEIEKDPTNSFLYTGLGYSYYLYNFTPLVWTDAYALWKERSIYAEEAFREAIRLNVNNIDAYEGLARTLYFRGISDNSDELFAEAEQLFETVMESGPSTERAYIDLALLKLHRIQFGNSPESYDEVISFLSRTVSPEAGAVLGYTYFLMGELDKSEVYFREAIRFNPEDSFSLDFLGWTLFRKHLISSDADLAEAKSYFERAIDSNPAYYQSYNGLGWIAIYETELQDATAYFEQSAQSNQDNFDYAGGLGWIALVNNDFSGAVTYYRQLYDARPSSVKPALLIAYANYKDGNGNEARQSVAGILSNNQKMSQLRFEYPDFAVCMSDESRSLIFSDAVDCIEHTLAPFKV